MPPGSPLPSRDVLVVEDDPSLRRTIAEALQMRGFQVTSARDGADALKAISTTIPRVILLDVRLPVMNGLEFAREVRRRSLDTRIIVMTGANDPQKLARDSLADGYLAKPFILSELYRTIDEALVPPNSDAPRDRPHMSSENDTVRVA